MAEELKVRYSLTASIISDLKGCHNTVPSIFHTGSSYFVCKSMLRENIKKKKIYRPAGENQFFYILIKAFHRGAEIYSRPTALLSDLWWQSSQREIT